MCASCDTWAAQRAKPGWKPRRVPAHRLLPIKPVTVQRHLKGLGL